MTVISTGQISIIDVNDGLSAQLSANSVLLPADASGVVTSYAGAETTFPIIEGGVDTSATWSYAVTALTGNLAYRDVNDMSDRVGVGTDPYFFTGSRNTKPTQMPGQSRASNATEAGYGPVYDLTSTNAALNDHVVYTPISGGVPALKLKVEVEYRVLSVTGTATGGSNNIQIQMGKLLGDYTGGAYVDSKLRVLTESDVGLTYTDTALFAATATSGYVTMDITSMYFRPYVRLVSATGQTITVRVMRITTTDISDANNPFKAAPDRYRANGLGALDSNYLRVVAAPKTSGYIDITATKANAQPVTRRFSVAKAATGQTGETGTRGTVTVSRAISGASWSDTEANTAVSGIGAGNPLKGDTVTLYRISPPYSETRIYSGTAWVTQAAYLAGSQIIDNSLPGTKITAASISATQIQAGAIVASKVLISDTSNIAKNGTFGYNGVPDLDGWNGLNGASASAVATSAADVPTGAPAPTALKLLNTTFVQDPILPYIDVVPGETYLMEVWIATTSNVNLGGGAGLGVTVQDRNGNNSSYPSTVNAPGYAATISSPTTAWTRLACTITIPATVANSAVSGRLLPRLTVRGQATSPVGSVFFTKYACRKVNNGEMIVDGTITANKLVTNIITTNYLATDSVTARNVLANSISVEKLLVGDQNDYIPNSSFDASGPPVTTSSTVSVLASSASEVPAGAPTPYVLKITARDHRPFPNINRIPARVGDKIYVSAMVAMPSGSTARFNLYMYRSATATAGGVSAVGVAGGQNATTTWTKVSGVYTCVAADEGKFIEPFLQLEQNSPFGSVAYVADWHCRRQTVGELIVDGTIKTNHFTANTLDASVIKANTINANKLNVTTRPLSTAGLNFRVDKDGVLQWDAGKVYYPNDAGTIIERSITKGGANWSGTTKYGHLYVGEGATNQNLDVFDDTRLVGNGLYRHLWTWEGGSKLTVFSGISTSINGGDIVTGTIRAAQIASRTILGENIVGQTITGNEIAADTITTNHMKAGSITTQLLAAGNITATKLGIGNTDNIMPDADYRDTDFWNITNDSKFELFDTTAPWTYARRGLRFLAGGNVDKRSAFFPVEPGATYKVKVSTFVGPNFNYADGWLNTLIHVPGYQWFNLKTGKQITNANNNPSERSDDSWTVTTGAGTVDVKDHILTIPANWDQRNIQFYFNGNVLGDIIEQAVSITRVSDATLIGDGAVITRHITVNTLEGDRVKVDTLDANRLKANSVMANTITVANTDSSVVGNIGDIALRAADPAARINNGPTTLVDPGRIRVFGGTTLNDWRDGTDINGGKLKTGSVLAAALTINSRGISTENIDFEVQTVNGGQELVWTSGGYVQYIASDTKAAKSVQIVHAGTTGTNPRSTFGVSKRCFVYWIEGETIFRVGTSAETILNNPNAVIIGTYMGGTNFNVYYGGTVINGSRITTGSISADRITAGSILSSTITVGSATGPTIAQLGTTATWANVSGTGKPADNATVGAPDNTYVGSGANKFLAQDLATSVANISSDNVLSKNEKSIAISDWSRATTNYQAFTSQATTLGVSFTDYKTAYDALAAYLGQLSPQWNQVTSDTPIVGETYRQKWYDYTLQEGRLLAALDAKTATLSTWTGTSGAGKPETYTVCARGNQTASGALPSNYAHGMRGSAGQVYQDTYNSGLRSDSYTRSYTVMWRSNENYWAVRHFDVYGGANAIQYPDEQNRKGAAGMASLLGQLANGTPIVIYTSDEPSANRLTGGLPDLIYNCGGSRAEFGSPTFAGWGAYILIGQKGIGENNGLEFRCGSGASIMTSFSIVNGVPMFGGKTLKDAQDISYSDGTSVNSVQPAESGATKGAPTGTQVGGIDVATLVGNINAITDDNIISPSEKTALYNQQQDVVQSENKVYLRATEYINANKGARYDIQTRRDALVSAKDTVLSRLSGVFTNMGTASNVNGAVVREAFNTFYDRYSLVQDSLQKLAAESGDWQQIGGTNKPADNATVGAPAGTQIAGVDAGTVAVSATNASNLSFYESVGNAGYSVLGNIVQRTADRGGFYGNVYSQEFGNGSARVSGRLLDKDTFLGLDIDRDGVSTNAYTTIQFAWHWSGGENNWQIYENNNKVWTGTGANGFNFDNGTLFSIEYDGKSIKYYANNAIVRTIPASPNALLAVAICIGPVGAKVGNVGLQVINDNSLANTDPADRINRHTTTVDGGKITTGSIDAGKINVDSLSAIKANLGSITAGKLTSVSGRTILDLNASKYEFEASEFRVKATGYNTTPFELVDGVLNLRNIAVDGGTLKNVSIATDKLQGNSVTTNAYMVIDYGGSINNIASNVWADFDTAQYTGGGGGGGGGSGGGGGGTPNVNLQ